MFSLNNSMVSCKAFMISCLACFLVSLQTPGGQPLNDAPAQENPYLLVTGTAQDAGYPQAGCTKNCCQIPLADKSQIRHPVSLSLVTPAGQWWLFEATPAIKFQLAETWKFLSDDHARLPEGVFVTHAHIGHYTGLMHFGREVMGARGQVVHALPRMKQFLENHGPWNQLVELGNIQVNPLAFNTPLHLQANLTVTPIPVPHRDEYSETAGFLISGPSRSALFIPDIDKWAKWKQDLATWIGKVDYALLDGTFFSGDELPGRNMEEIPHPFVTETMELLVHLPNAEKQKVYFIHFNHTNPLHDQSSDACREVIDSGFRVASQGLVLTL